MAAENALNGVGNPLREWRVWTGRAFHIRRRLTHAEQALTGPAIDLRGTAEANERLTAIEAVLPELVKKMAREELGEPR